MNRSTTMMLPLLVAAGLAIPNSADAAGFQNNAQSATSTALGGTGAGNRDEPNSSFYNPAAMMLADGFRIYVGPTLIIPTTTWEGEEGSAETKSQLLPPPNAHVGMTFEGFALGVGLTFPYGLTMEWPENWAGAEVIERQNLSTIDVNPNVAFSVSDEVSVAAGLQVVSASVELDRDELLRADRRVDVSLAGSGLGFGGTASVFYTPTSDLSFGLNYRSAVAIDFDGKVRFEGEENSPFEQTFVDQDVQTSITIPHTVVVGGAHSWDAVQLTLDIGYTTWSSYDRVDLSFSRPCSADAVGCDPDVDATNPPTSTIEANWFDSIALRVGGEYRAAPNLALRVGAAYDRSPIPEETVSPSLPGNHRGVGSAGVGYELAGLRADVGYQFVYTTREIDNGTQDGEYTTRAHLIGLNLGYGF